MLEPLKAHRYFTVGSCQPCNLSLRFMCSCSCMLSSSLNLPSCISCQECSSTPSLSGNLLLTLKKDSSTTSLVKSFLIAKKDDYSFIWKDLLCTCYTVIIYFHICLCINWAPEAWDHSSFIFVMSIAHNLVPSTSQVLKENLLIECKW